jgi:CRP-like cAMP-binding protein
VSDRLARTSDLTLTVGQRSAAAGLAAFLLEMHDRVVTADPSQRDLFLPMPRSDIADYLGLTPETVSRVFTRFTRQGLIAIRNRRYVKLLAMGSLQSLAEGLSAPSAT